jgi:hypothetical protein
MVSGSLSPRLGYGLHRSGLQGSNSPLNEPENSLSSSWLPEAVSCKQPAR